MELRESYKFNEGVINRIKSYNEFGIKCKGMLKDFPIEILALMVEYQVNQGNRENMRIFFDDRTAQLEEGGFDWRQTKEGYSFWYNMLYHNRDEITRRTEQFNVYYKSEIYKVNQSLNK